MVTARRNGNGAQRARAAVAKGALYTFAAVLAAQALAYTLPPQAQPFHRAGFLPILAVAIVWAWREGLRAGLAAGTVGALGIAHLFLVHGEPLGPPQVRLTVGGVIGLFGLGLAALIGRLRDRERRALETLVREREAAAKEEGHRFGIGRLFSTVGEGVIVTDATGRIILWNPAAERLFGHTREEALRMDVATLVPASLQARHHAGMARYRETRHGDYIDSRTPITLPAITKDGREITVEMTLSPIEKVETTRHAEGPFILALIRDVTERHRLTRELERSNQRLAETNTALREANETLEAFTYVASHDLKEPVRALEAYTQALLVDHRSLFADSPEARHLLERASDTSHRLAHLINGLLEYSRAARISPYELAPVRLEEALDSSDCRMRFEHLLAERGAHLTVDPGPPVLASAPGLCQVLGNLVLNAIKHNGDPAGHVRVRSAPSTESPTLVEVVVEDNGPGFPDPVIKAFGHTKTGRPSTIRGGFGLIITRQAVEKMGGTMWLRNLPEGGGAVHFTLPAAATPATSLPQHTGAGDP